MHSIYALGDLAGTPHPGDLPMRPPPSFLPPNLLDARQRTPGRQPRCFATSTCKYSGAAYLVESTVSCIQGQVKVKKKSGMDVPPRATSANRSSAGPSQTVVSDGQDALDGSPASPFAMRFWFFLLRECLSCITCLVFLACHRGLPHRPALGETVAFAADLVCSVLVLGSHLRSLSCL